MGRRCLLPGVASRQWHKGAFLGMRLGRAHPRVECAERHHPARRGIVEATALDAAHVQGTLVHKRPMKTPWPHIGPHPSFWTTLKKLILFGKTFMDERDLEHRRHGRFCFKKA